MESEGKVCHFGSKCHNKYCSYNHPHRAECRDGNLCTRGDCYYNHRNGVCRFGINCTVKKCKLRHQSIDENQSTTFADHPKQSDSQVILDHKEEMDFVKQEIERIKSSMSIDEEKSKGIVDVLQKQFTELQTQLEVYEIMKMRAEEQLTSKEASQQLPREIFRLKNRLPTFGKRIEIEDLINNERSRFLIIQGQTGSGKSTQIAQYLADYEKFAGKRIVCTQPRKLAALSLAKRVSFEYSGGDTKSKPGFHVGFHVGGQRVVGKNCRIEFVTESVMLEQIMKGSVSDFEDIGCIIVDEAHERSIICDLLLGSFKKDDPRWKDITIVVTSATIDLQKFSSFFNEAPFLEIEGRTFPVEVVYRPVHENHDIRNAVVHSALKIHKSCKYNAGDILCFLPGQEDVLSAVQAFEAGVSQLKFTEYMETKVFALYGKQEPEQQSQVFEKLPKHVRKIIFSTDIAETSVTIDGIVYVVDSGVKKEVVFDPKRNLSSLKVNIISKSSAIQRAGRCGRTQPGQCHRLYSEEDFENMNVNTTAEVFRKPLSLAVLSLRQMDMDPRNFDWLSAPSRDAILSAEDELLFLKALNEDKTLTDLGQLIAKCQQDPKLVKMIFYGCNEGLGFAAINIACILTVCNIFFWRGFDEKSRGEAKRHRQLLSHPEGDVVTMYLLFQQWLDILHGNKNYSVDIKQAPNENIGINPAEVQNTELLQDDNAANATISKEKLITGNSKKQAADFCKRNSINGKALSYALATRNELLAIFKKTGIWKQKSQRKLPTNKEIGRIVFSGYFLHTSRLIYSPRARTPQYFSLHSEVLGSLDFRAAILNHNSTAAADFTPPTWIIYDQILRISTTLFPTTNAVEESWIKEESQEFYKLCLDRCQSLPTEKVVISTSQECLRAIVGKYCSNLDNLEAELNCSLEVALNRGELSAYLLPMKKAETERRLSEKITTVLETFEKEVRDVDYLGRTRVVIGKGYEATEVLFPQEFSTLYISNIPVSCTKQVLWKFLTEATVCNNVTGREILRTLEMKEHEGSCSAVAKFYSKEHAKVAFVKSKEQMIGDNAIKVIPSGLSERKGVMHAASCRLKLSWAIGKSAEKAQITFSSPSQANHFIENIGNIIPGAKIGRVHGEQSAFRNTNENFNQKKPLPELIKLYGRQENRFRFYTTVESCPDLEYKLTVVKVSPNIDEYEIKERLTPNLAKRIKVDRNIDEGTKDGTSAEERNEKLALLKKYITDDTETRDFYSTGMCRAGIYIYFSSQSKAHDVYKKAKYSSLPPVFGHPHRLEMEYIHTTTIHSDLYETLKDDILKIKLLAKQKGIWMVEIPPKNKSRFMTLKFISCYANQIREIREKLEEISTCIKFSCEKLELLFTWMGRIQLMNMPKKALLHWNYQTHGIWIYGRPETREELSQNLKTIVDLLSSLEVLDQAFQMNKKKVNCSKADDTKTISDLCHKCGIVFHHFHGNKLFASGSKADLGKLEEELKRKQYLFERPSSGHAGKKGLPECGLCFCPVEEEKFIVMSLCGHAFCNECIQPMFDVLPPPIPITCQSCQLPLVLNDILKCAPQGTLKKFLEVSAIMYQKAHVSDILLCPKPGCNQLLPNNSATTGEQGGKFIFCDECLTTYCVICSDQLEKPVKSHEDYSCEVIQNGTIIDVDNHLKYIQENILNLKCPRCNTAFFEFEGCAAVTCGTCKCAFCGLCLKDCGIDAHVHVRGCTKNPIKNEYFVDKAVLNRVQRDMRVEKMRAYLNNVENRSVRDGIRMSIRKDLKDLEISVAELQNLPSDRAPSDHVPSDQVPPDQEPSANKRKCTIL